jgi:hypothetical protein
VYLLPGALSLSLYYLNVIENGDRLIDSEGTKCPDLNTARTLAVRSIRSMVAESFSTGKPCNIAGIEICDADGNLLLSVSVAEAIDAPLKRLLEIVQTSDPELLVN